MLRTSMDEAYDFLYVRTFGKIVDQNYLAYIGVLLNEYFNEKKVFDYTIRKKIMDQVIKRHVLDKLKQDPIFTPTIIEPIANEYN